MISVVFDGMVFLQAVGSRTGPAAACLSLVEQKHVKLLVSAEILEIAPSKTDERLKFLHDLSKRPPGE